MSYRVIECPGNGTVGQDCGRFHLADLPERLQAAVAADPDASEWTLPALSDGDSGEPLADLHIIITTI